MPTQTTQRAQWGSKIGFILAAAGSAIGLGNIWRFPYVTQENGGGIFVLFYLLAVVAIGLPVMLAEITLGRHTGKNPVGAFGAIDPKWKFVGALGVLTGTAILSYYGVVAGWTLGYVLKSAQGELSPEAFGAFVADPVAQVSYMVLFLAVTALVVALGVQKGIERMSRFLMPLLLLLLLGLIVRSLTLPTAAEGLRFYLWPNFEAVSAKTFLFAVGQAFFSLSLGMGAMMTYGGYLSKKENLVSSAVAVVGLDTLIAILAGFLIFPVIGHSLDKGGATLVFVTMIQQFNTMPGGQIVALFFFVLLALAALTSTVSLLEVATAYLTDEWKLSRKFSVAILFLFCSLLAVPSALSLGAVDWLSTLGGKGFLGWFDFLFGNISLTLGALLTCLFLAYRWGVKNAAVEIAEGCSWFEPLLPLWRVLLGVVVPLAILVLLGYMLITGAGLG